MLEFPVFDQNCYSIKSTGIYRTGHDSIRLMKWLIYYYRIYYDIMKYFGLLGSLCRYFFEIA